MPSSELVSLDPVLAIGYIGSLIVGVGFVLNQLGVWKANDFEYDFINLLGGLILLFYSYEIENWPFVILFVAWVVFSFKDCVFDYAHRFDWKKKVRSKKKK